MKDPEGWLERDDPELVAANDGPFKHHLDRYKYATRYADVDPEEHRSAALDILRDWRRGFRSQPICGARRAGSPISRSFPFIRQFANTDRDWFDAQSLPRLQDWLERLVTSELFTGVMAKHAQWKAA